MQYGATAGLLGEKERSFAAWRSICRCCGGGSTCSLRSSYLGIALACFYAASMALCKQATLFNVHVHDHVTSSSKRVPWVGWEAIYSRLGEATLARALIV
jgi:hypothetical protein